MKQLFFGPASRALYGVLHAPAAQARAVGLLLCHPLPFEYMRLRWRHRRLAELAASAGFAVLRFDWLGTGDSAGDLAAASLQAWADDVALAAAELKEAAGVERVCLAGDSLSATLAAAVVARGAAVENLLLIDPPLRGDEHLRWLSSLANAGSASHEDLLGQRLPATLRAELAAIDLAARPPRCAGKVLLIDTTGRGKALAAVLAAAGQPAALREVPAARDLHPGDLDESLLWAAVPEQAARLLAEELP